MTVPTGLTGNMGGLPMPELGALRQPDNGRILLGSTEPLKNAITLLGVRSTQQPGSVPCGMEPVLGGGDCSAFFGQSRISVPLSGLWKAPGTVFFNELNKSL
ncbi:hypothetical protein [Saccharospirillum mangrovi]|uniref:hypothetical protein n=1 Tax=Saccharospirillum mangrovi TaxID=2161747 RepID=UPI0013003090|nr:hypothetical protein [Saccharospirillum mangrovi]